MAATVNLAVSPGFTDTLAGCLVMLPAAVVSIFAELSFISSVTISAVPPSVTVLVTIFFSFPQGAAAYLFASSVLVFATSSRGAPYLIASGPPHSPSGKLRAYVSTIVSGFEKYLFATRYDVSYRFFPLSLSIFEV